MEFNFTTYEPQKRTMAKKIETEVEVKTNGRIAFNKSAAALLENKPYCMLAYDKDNKAIGILPTDAKDLNAFAIRHTNRGAYVGAKKFLNDTGLLPGANVAQAPVKAGQYIAVKL
ncbi:MAG TPA: hypothetical protein PKA10_12280 [Selenomonadales bacterium]|nr:hypothetical protein [Selenomonadales bacterium]